MSEEQLIEKLSNYLKDNLGKDLIKALKTALDKLQKENEQLQRRIKVSQNFAKIVERDYIDKDEIKQLIGYEENEDVSKDEIISLLKTIWEEFNRLEDIEDYMETQYISKKKIKEIKEKEISRIQKELVELNTNDILNSYTRKYTDIDINEYAGMEISRVLKELLGE